MSLLLVKVNFKLFNNSKSVNSPEFFDNVMLVVVNVVSTIVVASAVVASFVVASAVVASSVVTSFVVASADVGSTVVASFVVASSVVDSFVVASAVVASMVVAVGSIAAFTDKIPITDKLINFILIFVLIEKKYLLLYDFVKAGGFLLPSTYLKCAAKFSFT